MKGSRCLLIILLACYMCEAFKILVVYPMPGRSHAMLGEGVVRNLLESGHEVTFITPFLSKKPHKNLRQIDVSYNIKAADEIDSIINIKSMIEKTVNINDFKVIAQMMNYIFNITMNNENVQRLLNDPNETFDVAIIEWMFIETYAGFAAVYDCPYIWTSSLDPHWLVLRLIDESTNPAYNPDCQSSILPPFTFAERVTELLKQIALSVYKNVISASSEVKEYEETFGPILAKKGRSLPPYTDLIYNASLMLGNSHVSLGQPIRLPQNYIPVGGYHIDTNVKPLPEDLQKLMDGSKNGVIYFSMGSNLKSKDLPETVKEELVKMFGELKQTVIWKFEEILPNLPSNVHILQWAPQPSILAHPNCILFITHGGLLSTMETIFFGIPVIGIPVFGDQFTNIERVVKKGFGKKVDLSYSLANDLKIAIQDMLTNPIYRKRAKELSVLFHDRPTPPGKELVHWVEHVVRTRGAPHLRSPALMVPWYQKMYIDLLALNVVIFLVLKFLIKYLLSSYKNVSSRSKKNN